MKKKVIISLAGVAVILLSVLILFLYFQGKTDWYEAMSEFGPLNTMNLDPECKSNNSISSFPLEEKKDLRLSGDFTVNQGKAKIKILNGNKLLYEETFNAGRQSFETDVFEDEKGNVEMIIEAEDNVEGEYKLSIYIRERRWQKLTSK